jgi:cell division protein FtsB
MDLRAMTRRFLLGEAYQASPRSIMENLMQVLESMAPNTLREARKRDIALEQTARLRKEYLKMERKVQMLEEQVKTLEENKK